MYLSEESSYNYTNLIVLSCVIPAKAGIQTGCKTLRNKILDSRLHGNDKYLAILTLNQIFTK